MNKKALIIVGSLLVIFFVIYLIQRGYQTSTSDLNNLSELKIEFDKDTVTRISVFKQDYPDSGIHLTQLNDRWVVANAYNAPAKEDDIDRLMEDILKVTGTVRGESADLYPDFEITDKVALQIEMYDISDNRLLHLFIGKGGGTGRQCFMRLAGSPTVYLASENFISRFSAWAAPPEKNLPKDRWLNLNLCDLQRESINSMKIKKGKTEYEFARIELPSEDTLSLAPPPEAWKQISPEKGLQLDESKINSLFSSVSSIRASNVENPEIIGKFNMDNPEYSIWIADETGKSTLIKFSDQINENKDRYAVVDSRNAVYLFNDNSFIKYFETPFEQSK